MSKARSDIMSMGVSTDRRYAGPAIPDGGLIPLNSANVHVMTPFKTLDMGREARVLYQATRFYAAAFTPGDPVILDGAWGPRGHATTFAPYFVEEPDGRNRYLKPSADYQPVIDQMCAAIEQADPTFLQTVEQPRFWGLCNDTQVHLLSLNVPEVMRLGYLAAQQGQPIMVANDDMEWNQHLLHSTAEGWRMFWSSLAGDTDTNLVGNPSEVDTAVHDIFHGLTQNVNNESSLRLVDMRCLSSTVGIQNCFVEKQPIGAFRLDCRPEQHNDGHRDLGMGANRRTHCGLAWRLKPSETHRAVKRTVPGPAGQALL